MKLMPRFCPSLLPAISYFTAQVLGGSGGDVSQEKAECCQWHNFSLNIFLFLRSFSLGRRKIFRQMQIRFLILELDRVWKALHDVHMSHRPRSGYRKATFQ